MPATLSLRSHNAKLNEWLFSFTTKDINKLEECTREFRKIHSNKLVTSKIVSDPDVPGHYMFCGTCGTKEEVEFTIMYMENFFHDGKPSDDQYDYETDEA
jgi:hypothetical protein